MSGIIAPPQKAGAAFLPKAEQQSLAARVLGGAAATDGGWLGGSTRLLGESRAGGRAHHGDETELSRRIAATHHQGAEERGVAPKPVLNIIDVIFHRALHDIPGVVRVKTLSL